MLHYLEQKVQAEYHNLSLWYFVSFLFGIVYCFSRFENSPLVPFFLFSLSLLICIFPAYILFKKLLARFALFLIFSFVVGLCVAKYRIEHLKVPVLEKEIVSNVTGRIEAMKPTIRGMQVTLKETRVTKLDREFAKIRVSIGAGYLKDKDIEPGDKITFLAKLFSPRNSFIGNSNIPKYTYFAEVAATGYAMSVLEINDRSNNSKGVIHKIRMNAYDKLITAIGKVKGNFAAAILLGETKGIDKNILNNMRQSGISHILCVSGLHLSLVAMILFITTRFLLNFSNFIAFNFNIKMIAAITSMLGSYAYLELSGIQIAASRAFIMTSIFITAIIVGRSAFPMRSLGIAAVILLIPNPEYSFHPSFQLSFIAVISLIAGYEFYLKNQPILGKSKGIFAWIKLYIASNIYSSFLASVITAPVVINQFFIFSTYSELANLIAVPIMSFILMPLLILALVLMPFNFEQYTIKLAGFFIEIIIDTAGYINSFPASVWYFGSIDPSSLIIFLLGFLWLAFWQTGWRIAGFGVMMLSFMLMLFTPKPDILISPEPKAIVTFDQKGEPVIYAERLSDFSRNYIANWFGYKNAEVRPFQDLVFRTASGADVAINFSGKVCTDHAIQINFSKTGECNKAKLLLDINGSQDTQWVNCSKDSCMVKR